MIPHPADAISQISRRDAAQLEANYEDIMRQYGGNWPSEAGRLEVLCCEAIARLGRLERELERVGTVVPFVSRARRNRRGF